MKKEACVSISVGAKKPKEALLPNITDLTVWQLDDAGRKVAKVVTQTPEGKKSGNGVLTAGEDFEFVVVLRNPYNTTISGMVYMTVNGTLVGEGNYAIGTEGSRDFTLSLVVKGSFIPGARAYNICAGF